MSDLVQDVRYAVRSLLQAPGFALVAVLTLALGIGANSAIFSVVNGVILRPLPYEQPASLSFVTSAFPTMGFDQFWMSAPEYLELREWSESFADVGAYVVDESSVTGGQTPVRVPGAYVTASFFSTLGVPAARGRVFSAVEDGPGAEPTAVISWELWQRALGGEDSAVGGTLELDGVATTIIGVMPAGFDITDSNIDVWQPLGLDPANPGGRASHYLFAVARLVEGVTLERARSEMNVLISQWETRVPDGHVPRPDVHFMQIEPLMDEVVGDVRPALLLLLGAVGFVLVIACANVGNLLLARAESRQKEIAIRTALGASRRRLMQQFLTESMLLSLVGGAAGLLLGSWALQGLLATSPESIPRSAEVGLDGSVLGFTLLVAMATGLLFGLAPALHLRVRNMASAIREGGDRTTMSRARHRLRQTLVVAEVALAVVLVIGAGLMLRSFSSLQDVDPGFDPEGLLTFGLYLPAADYTDGRAQMDFFNRLVERLEAVPGVTAATAMNGLPPRRRINANDTEFDGLERAEDGPPHNVDYYQYVTAGYFDTMGIQSVSGRVFGDQDMGDAAQPVAVVNETLARTFFPGEEAVGRRLRPCCGDSNPWLTIVGVVEDVKQGGLESATGTELYFYTPQVAAVANSAPRTMNVLVRTSVQPTSLTQTVRDAVWALDANLPLANLQTMGDVLYTSVARPRFLTRLLGVFGGLALLLAAVGTYGVMSYTVAERNHEMGIRMALGAESSGVLRMVLGQGLRVAGVGLILGVLAALGLTRLMSSMLYGVGATDLVTFVAVPAVLLAVAVAACLVPARRATRVDPMVVLRS